MADGRRTKGADEQFCRSCGEVIKKRAELCPNCGVRNREATTGDGTPAVRSPTHDPSEYRTTVSENWYYAVAGSVVGWTLVLLGSGAAPDGGVLETLLGLAVFVAWAAMPVGMYYDRSYLQANTGWNPNALVWVGLSLVPLVNLPLGVVYLYRRHEVVGAP